LPLLLLLLYSKTRVNRQTAQKWQANFGLLKD